MNQTDHQEPERNELQYEINESFLKVIDIINLFIQDDIVDEAISTSKIAYDKCIKMCSESMPDGIRMTSRMMTKEIDDHNESVQYNAMVDSINGSIASDSDVNTLTDMSKLLANQITHDPKALDFIAFFKSIIRMINFYEVHKS